MTGRWLWLVIVANLAVAVALAFAYPPLMVSPGALEPGHAALAADCFACHTPLHGATSDRCIACHALPDIGRRTTRGVAISPPARPTVAFHQELAEQNCIACHSDHAGPKLTKHSRKPFSHALLRAATRERCEACHAAPAGELHRALRSGCAKCHRSDGWKPAGFDHAGLPPAELNRCEGCHQAPADTLHRQIAGNCASCHRPQAWKPATFDHAAHFPLDGDHNAPCATCHTGGDYARYTCYGCHEHTPANIQAKHREEAAGADLQDCVRCHRGGKGEGEAGGEGRKGRRGGD